MDEFVKVAVLDNEIEARLLESILSEQVIPFKLMSYHDMAYDGLFQLQSGWGAVYAPASYKDGILQILSDLRNKSREQ